MMSPIGSPQFTLDLLGNYEELKRRFFDADKQLEKLAATPLKPSYAMGRWKATFILATAPLRLIHTITILFTLIVATPLLVICSSRANFRKMLIWTDHYMHQLLSAFHQLHWGDQFLVPSHNDYRLKDSDIYNLDSVKKEKIPDPKIRESLHPMIKRARFGDQMGKGLCYGGTTWFNYLFLRGLQRSKLAKQCDSLLDYGKKIATLFCEGQPKAAAIIQSLYGIEKMLFPIEEWKIEISSEKDIKYLADGVYRVVCDKHALSYIKVGNEQMIWNPQIGLIEIKCSRDLEHCLAYFNNIKFYCQTLKQESLFARLCSFLGTR